MLSVTRHVVLDQGFCNPWINKQDVIEINLSNLFIIEK